MLEKISSIFNRISRNGEYRTVVKNFGFLSVLQVSNYIVPLITLPYLVNVLGGTLFGHIVLAQALIQYFTGIVEYGFNFSATRDISLAGSNRKAVAVIYSSVMILKLLFLVVSFLILVILIFSVDRFSEMPALYLLTFGAVVGNAMFPTFFFQGIERMKYITIINFISKTLYVVLVLLFVKAPDQFLLVPIFNAVCTIGPGLISLFYTSAIFPGIMTRPSIGDIRHNLKGGLFVFLSSMSGTLYGASNTVLLGFLFSPLYAGYYSLAEKITRAIVSVFVPFNNALFPLMSRKVKGTTDSTHLIKRMIRLLAIVAVAGAIFFFVASDLLKMFIDEEFFPSIDVFKVLCPILAVVPLSNFMGVQILITSGREKWYLLAIFTAGVLNLALCFLLSPTFSYFSAPYALVVSEVYICLLFAYFCRKSIF